MFGEDPFLIEDDAYGPGADLMISLFAIAMLLLSIVGVERRYEDLSGVVARAPAVAAPRPGPEAENVLVLSSRADLDAARERILALEQEVVTLKLAGTQAREAEAASRMEAEADRNDAENLRAARESDLRLAEKAARDLATRREQLDLARQTIALLKDTLVDVRLIQRTIPARQIAPVLSGASLGDAALSAAERSALAQAADAFPPQANQLFIDTSVPAELLVLAEGLDASQAVGLLERTSQAIASAFRQSLVDVGIPRPCMTLRPGGIEMQAGLRDLYTQSLSSPEMARIVEHFQWLDGSALDEAGGELVIQLGHRDGDRCTGEILRDALGRVHP